ncbi:MAG: hypothetical protein IID39_01715 [Planctomycetes bacterium]|nr:hypothetical protein [Planctomycetota bacterium]
MLEEPSFESTAMGGVSPIASPARSNVPGQPSLSELRRTLEGAVRVLAQHRWAFFLTFCLVTTAVLVSSLRLPRRYVAKTVFSRRDDPVLVRLPRHSGFHAYQEAKAFRQSLFQQVTSPEATERVVRNLQLVEGDGAAEADATMGSRVRSEAARIAAGINVQTKHESNHLDIIEMSYTTTDLSEARRILNAVRDGYIHAAQDQIHNELIETRAWFESQAAMRQPFVESLEDDLGQFKMEHRGVDPLQLESVEELLSQRRGDLADLEQKKRDLVIQIRGRVDFLEGEKVVQEEQHTALSANLGAKLEVMSLPRTGEGLQLLREIQRIGSEMDALKTTRGMTDFHPHIVNLRRRQEELFAELQWREAHDERNLMVNGVGSAPPEYAAALPANDPLTLSRQRIENEVTIYSELLSNTETSIQAIMGDIAEYESIRADAVEHRREFLRREGAVERARKGQTLYYGYADTVAGVLAAENSNRGILFEVIHPARCSSVPVTPRSRTVLMLAMLAGLASGVVMVLMFELFDRTIRTARQVSRSLGLTVLGCIDEIVSQATRRRRFVWHTLVAPAVAVSLSGIVIFFGALAYLSIENTPLYDRLIRLPRSAFGQMAEAPGPTEMLLAKADAPETN